MIKERSEGTQDKKKYRFTKQIIRIALDNGYTNADIAVKAGLSGKSIAQVSRWRNGEALATERQMNGLIKEFGHLLKRKLEHLFYSFDSEDKIYFFRIEGEILLKHVTKILDSNKSISIRRVIVIRSSDQFVVLFQKRLGLKDHLDIKNMGFSDNEDAHWVSPNYATFNNPQEMVEKIYCLLPSFKHQSEKQNNDNDRIILAFKIRQALLKLGLPTEDINLLDLSMPNSNNDQTQ